MAFAEAVGITTPLFALILLGFVLARFAHWPESMADALGKFVFTIAIPAMLFNLTSDIGHLPTIDSRVLIVYFGAAIGLFMLVRGLATGSAARSSTRPSDGVGATVIAMASTYGNVVLLGIPLVKAVVGEAGVPTVALVIVFNSVTLWTLATISVEIARGGGHSLTSIAGIARSLYRNPIIVAIAAGTATGLLGIDTPTPLRNTLDLLGQAAVALALVTLGLGLAGYRLQGQVKEAIAIGALKLVVMPALTWILARVVGLGPVETQTLVLLAAAPLGVNAYLAAREFGRFEAAVSAGVLVATAASAALMPVIVSLLRL